MYKLLLKVFLFIHFLSFFSKTNAQETSYMVSKDTTRNLYFSWNLPLDTHQYDFDFSEYFDFKLLNEGTEKNLFSVDVFFYYLIDSNGCVLPQSIEFCRMGGTSIVSEEYRIKIIEESKNLLINLPELTLLLRETDPSKTRYLLRLNYRKC